MTITVDNANIPMEVCHTLVIGGGAAGLNCADELLRLGFDTILASDDFGGGASRNAGSDKQTYHKLAQRGDSVNVLAQTLFAGGHMHGDIAMALAAGSERAFYKLVALGVPFPHDAFGEFTGYQTDHDEIRRATSAGPLTSRFMAERLEESCMTRGLRRVKGSLTSFLTENGRVCGALFLDREELENQRQPLTVVLCGQAVLCTGGSADLYEDSVHPVRQIGALGAALRIGARAANLWSWQYGLASKGVRWNLSGTYQQALPKYVDEKGAPVLSGWVHGNEDDAIFLKGYQWPFDSRKSEGSSRVDLAVYSAAAEGRKVFLDFRKQDHTGRLGMLGSTAEEYLNACGARQKTPFQRLLHMNPAAVEFYRSHDVDLDAEPLPIAVCAQHQNGGLSIDMWWRTSIPGLHCAGEAAGCFGAYRPGGSALNETQVGSLRVAQWIAARGTPAPSIMGEEAIHQIETELAFLRGSEEASGIDALATHEQLRKQFSLCAGPVRRPTAMRAFLEWVRAQRKEHIHGSPADAVRLRDALDCAIATLSAMITQAQSMPTHCGHIVSENAVTPDTGFFEPDDRFSRNWIETAILPGGEPKSAVRLVRPLPETGNEWFENVWRDFREGKHFDQV